MHSLDCHTCSSDSLEACATLTGSRELPVAECSEDVTKCYVGIQSKWIVRGWHGMLASSIILVSITKLDHATVRGCLTPEITCSENEESCQGCTSDRCNGNVFPENRLHCLHCSGSSCVNQTNTVSVRYPCVNYESIDSCYDVFSHGKFWRMLQCSSIDYYDLTNDFFLRWQSRISRMHIWWFVIRRDEVLR